MVPEPAVATMVGTAVPIVRGKARLPEPDPVWKT